MIKKEQREDIDTEDVIDWLTTQPNANGTPYLENVLRTYMSALRNAPRKLILPESANRNVFSCRTVAELDDARATFKSSPNYSDVNRTPWHGQLSAGLAVYRRYLDHLEKSASSAVPIRTEVKKSAESKGVQTPVEIDLSVVEKFTAVLSAHFSNGYRLNSPIEMIRFRSFVADCLGEEIILSDEEIRSYISACGTNFEGKVYIVSAEVKKRIKELAEDYGDVLLNYDQIAERLQYVPRERIKYALGQNGDFIWNSAETFSHINRIEITDDEREAVSSVAISKCKTRGYVSVSDLPFGEIEERNYELSVTAVHNAVFRICLADKFDKKGKIITRKGNVFNALTIIKEYCRSIDKCSLDDLLNLEKDLIGEVHRWIPMEAGYSVLVRIDKENYIADRFVRFDIDKTDKAIESAVKGDYLPLKSFTAFGAFPYCGQTWNLFLLESYCRRFSKKFRFDTPSVNSRNAGAVIRKSCGMDYTEIMADAVAKTDIILKEAMVGRFLFDNGYIGRSTTSRASELIAKAKNLRERRD